MAAPAPASKANTSPESLSVVAAKTEFLGPTVIPQSISRWPGWVIIATACASILLGTAVLVGWHTHSALAFPTLLEYLKYPIRYNAGLCFILSGGALLLLAWQKVGAGRVLASCVVVTALLTTLEYLLARDFGIDQLLFRSTQVAPLVPPRMSPNTAVCFLLLGGSLLLAGSKVPSLRNTLQAILGSLALAVSLAGFIGYVAHIPTAYAWGTLTPMAAPSAVVLCGLGLGLIAFAWGQPCTQLESAPLWFPPILALVTATVSVCLWQALRLLNPDSPLSLSVLVIGLVQAALLYLLVQFLASARIRARQLHQLNSVLQIQMYSLQRAERQLQEKQAYTRSLIEASLDPLVTIAPDGKITDVNAATEAATGLSRQELIGTDYCDYFTQPDKARAGYQQVFREGRVRYYELEIRHRDGHVIPVIYSASVYHSQAGAVAGVVAAARDITERKRAEEALRRSEARLQLQFERMPIGCVVWTRDFRVESWNPAAEKIFGFTAAEAMGRQPYDFLLPETAREKIETVYRRLMEADVSAHSENENLTRDGRRILCLWTNTPLKGPAGDVVGILSMVQDVTGRKQAEEELHKQAALLNLAHDAILVRDLESRVVFWNQGAAETYGWTAKEAIGQTIHELLQTHFPTPLQAIEAAVQQEGEWEGELQDLTRDGRRIIVASRWSLQRDYHGAPSNILEINRDITERKSTEEQLRRASLYTRTLLEASLDPLVTIGKDGRIMDVNQATEAATGLTRDQLIGSDFCEYFTDPQEARRSYQEVFAQGLVRDYPLAIRHADRQVMDVLYNATVFRNEAGEIEGVFAAARDITARKRLEDSLRLRTVELENAVKELEAFSYSVSHDLRAPLRSIDGFSQILLEDYRDNVDAEGRDFLQRIRAASQNMGQLIDALLQLSRVMRSELQQQTVDLSVLALSTAAMIQKGDPGRPVQFRVTAGLEARGDRRLLGLVLQNLLQNAWKFTAGSNPALIEVGATQKESKTIFYVRDNGIGFDMAYVDKLFTPFQRLHPKEQFEGTGIGLATVQRIIKRHSGEVWAEGTPGKGATFYFSLS